MVTVEAIVPVTSNNVHCLEVRVWILNLSGSLAGGNFVPWSGAAGCQEISSPPKLNFTVVIGSCTVMDERYSSPFGRYFWPSCLGMLLFL